jgi:ABC-type lipoprotein release transport system permease subunit
MGIRRHRHDTYTVIGLDPSGLNYSGIATNSLESGRFLNADDSGTGNVVIGQLIAGILDVTAGDDMILLSESVDAMRFHIVGCSRTNRRSTQQT